MADKKNTRRRHPRAQVQLKCRLTVADQPKSYFEATLKTADISIGGLFVDSTFFLKVGTRVNVEMELPPHGRKVQCRGRIVRQEQPAQGKKARSGFAVKFEEYVGPSEIVLANYFLGPILRRFLQGYTQQNKLQLRATETDQLVDVLAAWELWRATETEAQEWADHG